MVLRVHNDVNDDLREIHGANKSDAAKLVAFIQSLRDDEGLIARLLEHDYGKDRTAPIFVSRWESVHNGRDGKPLWRLRVYDLEDAGLNYRFIYLYYWRKLTHNLLAVRPKATFDYDSADDPIRQRILATVKREFADA